MGMKRDKTEAVLIAALMVCVVAQGVATILLVVDLGLQF